MNFPDYRYEQLIKMIFAQHVSDFHAMYMLPERLRANLAETFGASVSVKRILLFARVARFSWNAGNHRKQGDNHCDKESNVQGKSK